MDIDKDEVYNQRANNKSKREVLMKLRQNPDYAGFRPKAMITYDDVPKTPLWVFLVLLMGYIMGRFGFFYTIIIGVGGLLSALVGALVVLWRYGEKQFLPRESTKNVMMNDTTFAITAFTNPQDKTAPTKEEKEAGYAAALPAQGSHPHTHPWDDGEMFKFDRVTDEHRRANRPLLNSIIMALHAYAYVVFYHAYITIAIFLLPYCWSIILPWLQKKYHGKLVTLEDAKKIIMGPKEDIPRVDLTERIMPFKEARELVLSQAPHVLVMGCACRSARANIGKKFCEPVDVCLWVGTEYFINFAADHYPNDTRKITREEACEILEQCHKRGNCHTLFSKDAMGDTYYAICNCCKCCCGGVQAMADYGNPFLASSGYVAVVDEDRCVACGRCYEGCPFVAVQFDDNASDEDIVAKIKTDVCMGCGVCVDKCTNNAIHLERDPNKPLPYDIELIESVVRRQEVLNDW